MKSGTKLKPIPGYSKYYASELGHIVSFHKNGFRVLKERVDRKTRYHKVTLWTEEGEYDTRYVHRLVLMAFDRMPVGKEQARHGNNDRGCNRPDNLCWGTAKENDSDKDIHGTRQCGVHNGMHKLSESVVVEILLSPESGAELGRKYGIDRCTINKIRRRESWSHVKLP